MMINDHIEQLMLFMEDVEVDEAVTYLMAIADEAGFKYVIDQILDSFLLQIGKKWEAGEGISLTDTYVSSKIVSKFLEKVPSKVVIMDPKRRVILGNIQNDFQSAGRQLVTRFLEMDGWQVIDLGNDVAPEKFFLTAVKENIRFIGVSAMLYENALHIKALASMLNEKMEDESRPYLVVGGAVFTIIPTLVDELNVKYTAMNAFEAKKLFSDLYEEDNHG